VFAGCRKITPAPKPTTTGYFMSAEIGGQPWKITQYGASYFATGLNFIPARNYFLIAGADTTTGTICSYIFIQFGVIPTPGRYYFNNTGDVEAAGGAIAIFTHNVINHLADKWSTGGYVDIQSMTDTEIKGTFNFTAKGDATDTTTTVISQGQFDAVSQ